MCGLVGAVSFTGPVSRRVLAAGAEALGHRGPDGSTVWVADHGRVGFGHTRLGLVDPGAIQPIASEEEQLRIIVNGEFYDHDRLRTELRGRGHSFRTDTDSEIALHLYQERGARCLDDLRGEFAFAVWDEDEQALFAARDRFGIKPLFYTVQDGMVLFASEIKALFAMGVNPVWDNYAVFGAIHGCFSQDKTLFANIQQVPAGHSLRLTRAGAKITQYWDVDFPRSKTLVLAVDETEYVLEVRRLLEEAVTLRMRADVPVGYLLSGGLDSSAMIGIATAHAGTAQQAFTVSFDSDRYDESSAATQTAAHLGAELCVVRAGDAALADCFADAVVAGEGLQYNAHGPARFMLSRAIRDAGYRAVMGGEGADEAFAGYGFVRKAATLDPASHSWANIGRKALGLVRPLNDSERSLAQTSQLLARGSRLVDLPPWLIDRGADWLEAQRSILSPEFTESYRRRDPFFTLLRRLDLRGQVLGREPARQMLYFWLRSIFAGYHLGADRLDMAHSVETRLPYLDHHLFDYAAQIPIATLTKGGLQKHLLREAARPYVTDSVYTGAKQPFYAPPLASEPGTALHTMVRDLLSTPAANQVPFLDQTGCLALIDRLPTLDPPDRATLDPILLLAASLVVLQQHYRPSANT